MSTFNINLKDKVTLVAGASRGVGKGIARVLGECGATVYVTGRSKTDHTTENMPGTPYETAEIVNRAGGKGIPVNCDHSDETRVAKLFERIKNDAGKLDLLVNAVWAGYEDYNSPENFMMPFWDQPISRWNKMINISLFAHFLTSRYAVPVMTRAGSGLIVTLSAFDEDKYTGMVIYDVAKNASKRLATAMHHDLKKYNVASIALAPGFTHTERVHDYVKDNAELLKELHSPEYVGRAVASLTADPNIMSKSGKAFAVGTIAKEYGFTDTDGRYVPPFILPDPD